MQKREVVGHSSVCKQKLVFTWHLQSSLSRRLFWKEDSEPAYIANCFSLVTVVIVLFSGIRRLSRFFRRAKQSGRMTKRAPPTDVNGPLTQMLRNSVILYSWQHTSRSYFLYLALIESDAAEIK